MLDTVLNAANYEKLCNLSIIPPEGKMFNETFLKNSSNIFCKTDYIDYLFENIKHSKHSYNLITHHSDYPIDEERFFKKPKCIKKWYAINPTVRAPDLIPIPLGLKTHSGVYLESQYMTEWFCTQILRLQSQEKTFKVYCNWNITNVARNDIVASLIKNNIPYTHDYNQPFNSYIENLAKHKFVLSPPGNGIDCHRTWEALYCGCIPIVLKNKIYDSWNDLPILQVESFESITVSVLSNFLQKKFYFDKLNIEYWKSKIQII